MSIENGTKVVIIPQQIIDTIDAINEAKGVMRLVTTTWLPEGIVANLISLLPQLAGLKSIDKILGGGNKNYRITEKNDTIPLRVGTYTIQIPAILEMASILKNPDVVKMCKSVVSVGIVHEMITYVKEIAGITSGADTDYAKTNTLSAATKIGATGVDTRDTIDTMITNAKKHTGFATSELRMGIGEAGFRKLATDYGLVVTMQINDQPGTGNKRVAPESLAEILGLREIVIIENTMFNTATKTHDEMWDNNIVFMHSYKKEDAEGKLQLKNVPSTVLTIGGGWTLDKKGANNEDPQYDDYLQRTLSGKVAFDKSIYTELKPFAKYGDVTRTK